MPSMSSYCVDLVFWGRDRLKQVSLSIAPQGRRRTGSEMANSDFRLVLG